MNTKKFIGLALLAFSLQVLGQTTMTLKQCVETGINNNFDVRQRELQLQSDEANWKQSRLNIFPDLNANAGHSFNQGRSIRQTMVRAVVLPCSTGCLFRIQSNKIH